LFLAFFVTLVFFVTFCLVLFHSFSVTGPTGSQGRSRAVEGQIYGAPGETGEPTQGKLEKFSPLENITGRNHWNPLNDSQVETKVEVEAPPVQCGSDDLLQYFNSQIDMWKQGLWRHQSRRVKNPRQ